MAVSIAKLLEQYRGVMPAAARLVPQMLAARCEPDQSRMVLKSR